MIFIINREGTTINAISSPIYEGSTGVNTITLFAPYPANTQILVTAILPNGVPLRNLYPMSAIIPPTSLKDVNGNGYCVFQCTIDENITALTGTVQLFFTVLSGVGKKLNTYTTGFAVSGGNIRIEEIEIPSDSDYIEAVLQYLAELNSDPVQSVVYEAENALISPNEVSAYPTGYNGYISSGFTAEGTTEFIGVDGDFFFLVTSLDGNSRVGFTIDLETVQEVKLLQLFMNSATVDINITVEYGATLDSLQTITEKINATSYAVNITPRILLNSDARYIRVSFDQNVVVQGIQIFAPSNNAEYVITQKSGAQAVIELSVASVAVDTALSLTSRNPVENRVIAQALQGKQDTLTFDNTPTQGSNNPVTSNGVYLLGQSLRSEIENITVPNIYYESNFNTALGAVLSTPSIKANDIIIIIDKGTPDLAVFNANGQAGSGATVITEEQIYNGTVPTPQAGDRFIVANTGLGVICLESGIVEPNIVIDNALSPTSENPVQNKVITEKLGNIETALSTFGQYRVVRDVTLAEDTQHLEVTQDTDGVNLNLKKFIVLLVGKCVNASGGAFKVDGNDGSQYFCYLGTTLSNTTQEGFWLSAERLEIDEKVDNLAMWRSIYPKTSLGNFRADGSFYAQGLSSNNADVRSDFSAVDTSNTIKKLRIGYHTDANALAAGTRILVLGVDNE